MTDHHDSGQPDPRRNEATARKRPAGGRVAVSTAEGGAQARPRSPLVVIGKDSATPTPRPKANGHELPFEGSLEGRVKRLVADRARALISEACGDMPEAAKLRNCGVRIRHGLSDVAVERHPKGYAYASGLQTCGSVWACPICSFKIRVKRAAELAVAIAVHTARGGSVFLLTLTTQHVYGEALNTVWSDLQDVWAFITSHSRYRAMKERLGLGYCRTVEVMHGGNGWHPHLHVLLFTDVAVDPFDDRETYDGIARTFHDLWTRRMTEHHGRAVRSAYAVDLRPVKADGAEGVGMYCTKAGYEVALADGKEGRTSTSRHPFAIAYDAVETGDTADIGLFREWIEGSHNRKMWTWSRGLRERLGLSAEKTDDELAAEADETIERVCTISPLLWRAIVSTRIGLRAMFLTILDVGSPSLNEAIELLATYGIGVVVETRPSSAPRLRALDEPRREPVETPNPNKEKTHVV